MPFLCKAPFNFIVLLESSDEGIGMTCTDAEDHGIEDYKRELMELRSQLEQERRHRLLLERRLLAVSNMRDDDTTKCKTEVGDVTK